MTKRNGSQKCPATHNDHMLFESWVKTGVVSPGMFDEGNTQEELLARLLRLLDKCRHRLPDPLCDDLRIKRGSTYSAAARHTSMHPRAAEQNPQAQDVPVSDEGAA